MASDLFTLAEIESVLPVVRSAVPPTAQYARGRRVGLVLSGQNIDRVVMGDVLAGRAPA